MENSKTLKRLMDCRGWEELDTEAVSAALSADSVESALESLCEFGDSQCVTVIKALLTEEPVDVVYDYSVGSDGSSDMEFGDFNIVTPESEEVECGVIGYSEWGDEVDEDEDEDVEYYNVIRQEEVPHGEILSMLLNPEEFFDERCNGL